MSIAVAWVHRHARPHVRRRCGLLRRVARGRNRRRTVRVREGTLRNSRWTTLLAVAGALLALLTLAAGAAAQATPLPLPATPNPAECAVKPRTIAEMRRLAAGPATPPAVPPIIGPRPYTPPSGTPADAA